MQILRLKERLLCWEVAFKRGRQVGCGLCSVALGQIDGADLSRSAFLLRARLSWPAYSLIEKMSWLRKLINLYGFLIDFHAIVQYAGQL